MRKNTYGLSSLKKREVRACFFYSTPVSMSKKTVLEIKEPNTAYYAYFLRLQRNLFEERNLGAAVTTLTANKSPVKVTDVAFFHGVFYWALLNLRSFYFIGAALRMPSICHVIETPAMIDENLLKMFDKVLFTFAVVPLYVLVEIKSNVTGVSGKAIDIRIHLFKRLIENRSVEDRDYDEIRTTINTFLSKLTMPNGERFPDAYAGSAKETSTLYAKTMVEDDWMLFFKAYQWACTTPEVTVEFKLPKPERVHWIADVKPSLDANVIIPFVDDPLEFAWPKTKDEVQARPLSAVKIIAPTELDAIRKKITGEYASKPDVAVQSMATGIQFTIPSEDDLFGSSPQDVDAFSRYMMVFETRYNIPVRKHMERVPPNVHPSITFGARRFTQRVALLVCGALRHGVSVVGVQVQPAREQLRDFARIAEIPLDRVEDKLDELLATLVSQGEALARAEDIPWNAQFIHELEETPQALETQCIVLLKVDETPDLMAAYVCDFVWTAYEEILVRLHKNIAYNSPKSVKVIEGVRTAIELCRTIGGFAKSYINGGAALLDLDRVDHRSAHSFVYWFQRLFNTVIEIYNCAVASLYSTSITFDSNPAPRKTFQVEHSSALNALTTVIEAFSFAETPLDSLLVVKDHDGFVVVDEGVNNGTRVYADKTVANIKNINHFLVRLLLVQDLDAIVVPSTTPGVMISEDQQRQNLYKLLVDRVRRGERQIGEDRTTIQTAISYLFTQRVAIFQNVVLFDIDTLSKRVPAQFYNNDVAVLSAVVKEFAINLQIYVLAGDQKSFYWCSSGSGLPSVVHTAKHTRDGKDYATQIDIAETRAMHMRLDPGKFESSSTQSLILVQPPDRIQQDIQKIIKDIEDCQARIEEIEEENDLVGEISSPYRPRASVTSLRSQGKGSTPLGGTQTNVYAGAMRRSALEANISQLRRLESLLNTDNPEYVKKGQLKRVYGATGPSRTPTGAREARLALIRPQIEALQQILEIRKDQEDLSMMLSLLTDIMFSDAASGTWNEEREVVTWILSTVPKFRAAIRQIPLSTDDLILALRFARNSVIAEYSVRRHRIGEDPSFYTDADKKWLADAEENISTLTQSIAVAEAMPRDASSQDVEDYIESVVLHDDENPEAPRKTLREFLDFGVPNFAFLSSAVNTYRDKIPLSELFVLDRFITSRFFTQKTIQYYSTWEKLMVQHRERAKQLATQYLESIGKLDANKDCDVFVIFAGNFDSPSTPAAAAATASANLSAQEHKIQLAYEDTKTNTAHRLYTQIMLATLDDNKYIEVMVLSRDPSSRKKYLLEAKTIPHAQVLRLIREFDQSPQKFMAKDTNVFKVGTMRRRELRGLGVSDLHVSTYGSVIAEYMRKTIEKPGIRVHFMAPPNVHHSVRAIMRLIQDLSSDYVEQTEVAPLDPSRDRLYTDEIARLLTSDAAAAPFVVHPKNLLGTIEYLRAEKSRESARKFKHSDTIDARDLKLLLPNMATAPGYLGNIHLFGATQLNQIGALWLKSNAHRLDPVWLAARLYYDGGLPYMESAAIRNEYNYLMDATGGQILSTDVSKSVLSGHLPIVQSLDALVFGNRAFEEARLLFGDFVGPVFEREKLLYRVAVNVDAIDEVLTSVHALTAMYRRHDEEDWWTLSAYFNEAPSFRKTPATFSRPVNIVDLLHNVQVGATPAQAIAGRGTFKIADFARWLVIQLYQVNATAIGANMDDIAVLFSETFTSFGDVLTAIRKTNDVMRDIAKARFPEGRRNRRQKLEQMLLSAATSAYADYYKSVYETIKISEGSMRLYEPFSEEDPMREPAEGRTFRLEPVYRNYKDNARPLPSVNVVLAEPETKLFKDEVDERVSPLITVISALFHRMLFIGSKREFISTNELQQGLGAAAFADMVANKFN
jgi:hypothetical protein